MAVYTWGLGKNGQLGTGKADTEHTPQHIVKTAGHQKLDQAIQVSCGALFTAVLTANGQAFTTGCGKYERLGLGLAQEDVCVLLPVKILDRVTQLSCGSWHAAAVAQNGHVYVWGYKKACGDAVIPPQDSAEQKGETVTGIPNRVLFTGDIKIAGVACGHNYTYVWTTDGQVFSWGRGQEGVLGLGSFSDVTRPTRLEHLSGQVVVSVGAGHSHCGIVTAEGLLFMTGKGSDGALGLGQNSLKNISHPAKCSIDGGITAVSCSKGEHHGHTLALTRDGRVLAWGDGYKGKLGLGDQETRYIPTVISQECFDGDAVSSISAGGIHSAAATQSGNIYTWGCGSDGRLGHPDGQGHRYLFRSDVPRKVEQLPKCGKSPALVAAAYYHTAAIISSGEQ